MALLMILYNRKFRDARFRDNFVKQKKSSFSFFRNKKNLGIFYDSNFMRSKQLF